MNLVFNMQLTLKNKTLLVTAKRGSGKSNIIKWLVQAERRVFKKIFLISPTEQVNRFFGDFIPADCIFEQYSEKWAEELIAKMTSINTGKSGAALENILVIMDDCISDTNFHASPTIKKLFTRGRHIGIAVVVTTQYLFSVPPVIRSNSDFILCGQMNRQSVTILTDEYMSVMERGDFVQMYSRATKDFSFLLINNTSVKDCDDPDQLYGVVRCPDSLVR
jgi:hypothetical protein